MIVKYFCIAKIHLQKTQSENVIPMLGGKRISKTRKKRPTQQTEKSTKVKESVGHFQETRFYVIPAREVLKQNEMCIPTDGEKQKKSERHRARESQFCAFQHP